MKAVVVMFDSLNRHLLSPYGCEWTHTPNFKRLAERTVTFDRSYQIARKPHRLPAFAGTCLWGGARASGHNHQGIVGGESL